jgi:hypothetical protein
VKILKFIADRFIVAGLFFSILTGVFSACPPVIDRCMNSLQL